MEQEQLERIALIKDPRFLQDESLLTDGRLQIAGGQSQAREIQVVNHILFYAPLVSPAPGFTQRWQMRLENENSRVYRKQIFIMLLLCLAMSGIVTWLLMGQLLIEVRWLPILVMERLGQVSWLLTALRNVQEEFLALLGGIAGLMMSILMLVGGGWGIGLYLFFARNKRAPQFGFQR